MDGAAKDRRWEIAIDGQRRAMSKLDGCATVDIASYGNVVELACRTVRSSERSPTAPPYWPTIQNWSIELHRSTDGGKTFERDGILDGPKSQRGAHMQPSIPLAAGPKGFL